MAFKVGRMPEGHMFGAYARPPGTSLVSPFMVIPTPFFCSHDEARKTTDKIQAPIFAQQQTFSTVQFA